jgi:acetyltransferase-like isoleucine patch superfamily enzyme
MIRRKKLKFRWSQFWMRYAGIDCIGRFAARLASWTMPPYYGCVPLAKLSAKGYISPTAVIYHESLKLGKHCFIGDRVTIYRDGKGGGVILGDAIHLHNNITIQTGSKGVVNIGSDTHIQPRCQISAYMEAINIGSGVEIAPNCAFYSYNHSMSAHIPIREQPLTSKGSIVIGDGVWLGYGVVVLDGVNIGKGAVIGAGSIVTDDIPENAIAVGSPARVVSHRNKFT